MIRGNRKERSLPEKERELGPGKSNERRDNTSNYRSILNTQEPK